MSERIRIKKTDELEKLLKKNLYIFYGSENSTLLNRKDSRRNYNSFISSIEKLKKEIPFMKPQLISLCNKNNVISVLSQSVQVNLSNNNIKPKVILPQGTLYSTYESNGRKYPNITLVGESLKDSSEMLSLFDDTLNNDSTLILINPDLSKSYLTKYLDSYIKIKEESIITIIDKSKDYTEEQRDFLEEISYFLVEEEKYETAVERLLERM